LVSCSHKGRRLAENGRSLAAAPPFYAPGDDRAHHHRLPPHFARCAFSHHAGGAEWTKIEDWRLEIKSAAQSPISNPQSLDTLLLFWAAFGSIRLWPHQEAFFNELAGGPENGSELLVDANIDWGQDLIFLRQLLLERA
jgi:hypothetical protein